MKWDDLIWFHEKTDTTLTLEEIVWYQETDNMTLTEKEHAILEKLRLLAGSDDPCWRHLHDLLLDSLTRLASANAEYNVGEPIKGKFPEGGLSVSTFIIDNARRISSHTKISMMRGKHEDTPSWRDKAYVDTLGYALLGACYLKEFGPMPHECCWPKCECVTKDRCACVSL